MKKQEFVLTEKIKEIEIDKFQANFLLNLMLVLFNIFLFAAVVTFVMALNRWYVWLIIVLIEIFCVSFSVVTFFKAQKNSFEISSNAISIKTAWFDGVIKLNCIYKITPKQTLFDKMMKRNNYTLTIYFNDNGYFKIKIYNIKENVNELINLIMHLSIKTRESLPAELTN